MNSREQARVCHSSELNKDSSSRDQNWVLPSRYFHGSRQVREANIFYQDWYAWLWFTRDQKFCFEFLKKMCFIYHMPPYKKESKLSRAIKAFRAEKGWQGHIFMLSFFKNIHANAVFRLPSCSQFYANMDPDWSNHLHTGSILSWQHQRTKSDSNVLVGSIWREGGSVQRPI